VPVLQQILICKYWNPSRCPSSLLLRWRPCRVEPTPCRLQHVTPPPRSLISSPADRWSSSSELVIDIAKVGASRSLSRALLWSPPPFGDPLGEFPLMRHVYRVKPHKKWHPIAWATPGSGEPPPWSRRVAARYAATSPAPSQPSTPWSTA
jgi:hypothetical protein